MAEMEGWTLQRIAELCGGRLQNARDPQRVCPYGAVGIDTRLLNEGELFVALRGARDGHDFLHEGAARGAVAALVDHRVDLAAPEDLPLVRVEDPLIALQKWAATHRSEMHAELIAVTGSSGKTTTKDRIADVLSIDGPTHRTAGNRNNHIGVPLTLLGLGPRHRWGVVEIAMNHPGEIAPLSRMIRPRHLVLTRIGWAHVGAFENREAILAEKLSSLAGLGKEGILFHEHDPWMLDRLPAEVRDRPRRTFGLSPEADCCPSHVEWEWDRTLLTTSPTGRIRYQVPGPGATLAGLASILVGTECGIAAEAIRSKLEEARPRALRMEPRRLGRVRVLLDCYNASPESSELAIRFLSGLATSGKRRLAFGEMLELGARSGEIHRRLGELSASLDAIYLLGEGTKPLLEGFRAAERTGRAQLYDSRESMAADLLGDLEEDDIVLFKGARRTMMERVYETMQGHLNRTGD